MNNKINTKSNLILGIGIVLMSLIGITFAYFTTNMKGDNGLINFASGTVGKVVFDGGNDFTTSGEIEVLPWSESKTFKITVAPSTVSQTISVYMDYKNTIPDLKCYVKEGSSDYEEEVVLSLTGTSLTEQGSITTTKLVEKTFEASNSTQTVTYTLKMTIPETGVDQKASLNQIFNGSMYARVGDNKEFLYYNTTNKSGTSVKPSGE